MNKQQQQQRNPKREAFKRFSQMGAAGVALLSLSAFNNLSAQERMEKIESDTIQKQTPYFEKMLKDTTSVHDKATIIESDPEPTPTINRDQYRCYADYSNIYADNFYAENYSNYCDTNL